MTPLPATRWHVLLRWEDGHRSRLVYEGPLWVGRVSQDVHRLAQAEHARRRETSPGLPTQLTYEIVSFRRAEGPEAGDGGP